MANLTTRRGLLGAAVATPIVALLPPATGAMSVSHGAIELDQAIARYRAAEVAWDAFDKTMQAPLRDYARAVDAIPHRKTVATYSTSSNPAFSLSTSDTAAVAVARKIVADADKGLLWKRSARPEDGAFIAVQRELAALADERHVEADRLRRAYRIPAWRRLEQRYVDRVAAASAAVLDAPVATVSELVRKIDFIDETETWDNGGSDAVAADIRLLAGEVRA